MINLRVISLRVSSYEPVFRDLTWAGAGKVTRSWFFPNQDIGNQAESLSHRNTPARSPGQTFFDFECFASSLTKQNAASDNVLKHSAIVQFFSRDGKPVVQLLA